MRSALRGQGATGTPRATRRLGGRHRKFAQKRIIEMLDIHGGILTGAGPRESGWLAPVQLWDNTYFRQV